MASPRSARIDLWRIDAGHFARAPLDYLDGEERARALSYRLDHVRNRFACHRSALRRILSGYCHCSPHAVALVVGPHGKPALAGEGNALAFNLSHAGDLALVAVVRNARVGVDIEPVAAGLQHARLARQLFSPAEHAAYGRLPLPERGPAFLRCWTRKEAYLKATGHGLSIPLRAVEVGFGAIEVVPQPARDPSGRWHIRALAPWPGMVGALAIDVPAAAMRWFDLVPHSHAETGLRSACEIAAR